MERKTKSKLVRRIVTCNIFAKINELFSISSKLIDIFNDYSYFEDDLSCAYVFGKKHLIKSYQLSTIVPSENHLVLYDGTDCTRAEWTEIATATLKKYDLFEEQKLDMGNIRKQISDRILFVGCFNKNRESIRVYTHESNSEVDSIIIDNDYFHHSNI